MAQDKKGFILYADLINTVSKLPDDKAGQLFKLILEYVNDLNPNVDDLLLSVAFEPIKQQLKRDLKHYESVKKARSESGKKGGRPKKQTEAKKTNAFFEKQTKAKKAVIDNVNDNVIVNDKVTVTGKEKTTLMSEANASNISEINLDYLDLGKAYYELFKKNQSVLNVEWVHLKKITAKNFIDPIRLMIINDKRTIEDLICVGKFLKNDSFWMQNIQSTSKLREKFDQLITKAKNHGRSDTTIQISDSMLEIMRDRSF